SGVRAVAGRRGARAGGPASRQVGGGPRFQPRPRCAARDRPGRAGARCRARALRGRQRMSAARVGVLLMAYGTPRDRDDVETYYTDIRRGRPPTPELLADLVRRY